MCHNHIGLNSKLSWGCTHQIKSDRDYVDHV